MTTIPDLERPNARSGARENNEPREKRAELRLAGGRRTFRGMLGIFCAVLSTSALGSTADIPSPEKLLPDDTMILVTVPDYAKMREIWKNSPETLLWNDPAMKPFKDKFVAKWNEEFLKPLERDLGVRFDDYSSLLQGQLTFAVTQNGWQGSSDPLPSGLLLLDSRDKSNSLKKSLSDLRKKWVDAGKTIRTEKIRGIEFSVVSLSTNDVPRTLQKFFPQAAGQAQPDDKRADMPRSELAVGQFESLLIAGTSTKALDKVMAHLTGGSTPALGDLAAYEANRLALFRDAPFCGWVNVKSFVDLLNRKAAGTGGGETPDPMDMLSPAKLLKATGVSSLRTLAFNVQHSSDGSFVQLFLGVPEASRQGIFNIFTGEGKDSSPPAFVPANVAKFQRWRIDGQKAWATLQSVMNDINPQLLGGLNFLLETANSGAKEKDPGFDIKRNLFGNLGDDIISYQKAPSGATPAELNSAPSLFLIGSPQPEQLAAALKSVAALLNPAGGPPAEREFLGRKIFSVALPGMPLASADPSKSGSRMLSWSSSGGYVALTTEVSILEEYLRSSDSQQKKLREMPGLVDAAAKAGGTSTGWLGYENQADISRILFETLRLSSAGSTGNGTNAAVSTGSLAFPDPAGGIRNWMDFSLLPPFEKIAKYFYFVVYTASVNSDGLTFKWYAPAPPALKKQP